PPTPTPNVFATPFSRPSSQGTPDADVTATLGVAPTVTLRGQSDPSLFEDVTPDAAATAVPTLPPVTEACNAQVRITSPPAGVAVDGNVTFFGTATDEDFGRYDLQALGPQTEGEWASLLNNPSAEPVQDNILGSFNFANWLSGDYVVRILVTNTAGEEVGQC